MFRIRKGPRCAGLPLFRVESCPQCCDDPDPWLSPPLRVDDALVELLPVALVPLAVLPLARDEAERPCPIDDSPERCDWLADCPCDCDCDCTWMRLSTCFTPLLASARSSARCFIQRSATVPSRVITPLTQRTVISVASR